MNIMRTNTVYNTPLNQIESFEEIVSQLLETDFDVEHLHGTFVDGENKSLAHISFRGVPFTPEFSIRCEFADFAAADVDNLRPSDFADLVADAN